MKKNIFLFTNTFPFGTGETFLTDEVKYLSDNFETVYIIPLQIDNEIRKTPDNVVILSPLISFDAKKSKLRFIINGVFNLSPYHFAYSEWKINKPYKNTKKIWEFFTSLLRFRIIYKNLNISPKCDDVVYFYWGDKSVLLAPFLKSKFNMKIVVRFHGSDLYEDVKVGYIPFRHFIFPAITKFVFISENGHQYILQKYPQLVDKKKTAISSLGVSDCGINKSNTFNTDYFHIVSCSAVVELKRIDIIIRSLRLIDFKIKWTHIGDGLLRSSLQENCRELPENVEVVWTGHKNHDEVITFYQDNYVNLFLNVSSSEGIPVSIMEAMSFGIPAMATNVGGVSELVNRNNGVLLPATLDEFILASAIYDFYHNNHQVLRKNARKYWEQHFNADKNYPHFVKLLLEEQ